MSSSGRHHVADLATPCLASARSDLSPPLMHPPTLGCSNYSRHNEKAWLLIARFFSLIRHRSLMPSLLNVLEWMAHPYCLPSRIVLASPGSPSRFHPYRPHRQICRLYIHVYLHEECRVCRMKHQFMLD